MRANIAYFHQLTFNGCQRRPSRKYRYTKCSASKAYVIELNTKGILTGGECELRYSVNTLVPAIHNEIAWPAQSAFTDRPPRSKDAMWEKRNKGWNIQQQRLCIKTLSFSLSLSSIKVPTIMVLKTHTHHACFIDLNDLLVIKILSSVASFLCV